MLEYCWLFALLLRSARYFPGIEGKWIPLPPMLPPSSPFQCFFSHLYVHYSYKKCLLRSFAHCLSFHCWIVKVLSILDIISSSDKWFTNIFSLYGLSSLSSQCLWCTNALNFDEIYFSIFNLVAYAFVVITKNLLPSPRSQRFFLIFSFKEFGPFMPLVYFEVIFVYDVRQGLSFILLHVDTPLFQHDLFKRIFFSHCVVLASLLKINWL